jgi:hypothetical protein
MTGRLAGIALAVTAVAALVALPALAASPTASGAPGKADKVKAAGVPISLSGTISAAKGAGGETSYTLQSGGTTYTLEAGPPWFFGDNHPLKAFVGKSVSITGEKAADSNEVDVKTVNGTALRGEGKPAWAGGWKRVGQSHPGWSQVKADRLKEKFGDCFPPGQCKDKPAPAASTSPTR